MISLDSVDFEKDFLADLLDMINKRLETLNAQVDWAHPEDSELFEPMEHLTGVGAVAIQRYLASVCSFAVAPRDQALLLGPKKKNEPIANVLHSVANCWKHAEDGDPIRATTRRPLCAIGVDPDAEYFVTNTLYELGYSRFVGLMPDLISWRDEVYAKYFHKTA